MFMLNEHEETKIIDISNKYNYKYKNYKKHGFFIKKYIFLFILAILIILLLIIEIIKLKIEIKK